MDNLTHSLVGLLIARAAGKESFPQAAAICIVAANAPDIDIITLFDPATYLTYHRHLTHSVLAIPVMAAVALLLVAGWNRLRRRSSPGLWSSRAWILALLAAASHVALDMTNSYGVRLWLPFSSEWSSWDVFFIIDPVIWMVLGGAAVAPLWWGRKRSAASVGLIAILVYAGVTLAIKFEMKQRVQVVIAREAESISAQLFPAPLTPWEWSVHLQSASGESISHWNGLAATQPTPTVFPPVEQRIVDAVLATNLGRFYYEFARYPLFVTSGENSVRLGDYRFIREGQLGLSCRFDLDVEGRVTGAEFEF